MKDFLGYSVDEVAVRSGLCMLKLSLAITLQKHVQETKGSLARTMALQVLLNTLEGRGRRACLSENRDIFFRRQLRAPHCKERGCMTS